MESSTRPDLPEEKHYTQTFFFFEYTKCLHIIVIEVEELNYTNDALLTSAQEVYRIVDRPSIEIRVSIVHKW